VGLSERVKARTGSSKAAMGAIAQALLGRCVSPALAAPHAYGLATEPPPPAAKPALVLLSYVARHLGAGTAFNLARDPTKQALNHFLQSHAHVLDDFLTRMAAPLALFPPAPSVPEPTLDTVRTLIDVRMACIGPQLEQLCAQLSAPLTVEVGDTELLALPNPPA
jgi:hypothetical protein